MAKALCSLRALRVKAALQRAPGASRADVLGSSKILAAAIGSNCLVLVTSTGLLLRWTVPGPPPTRASQCVSLLPRLLKSRDSDKEFKDVMHKLFVDFSGWHVVVSVASNASIDAPGSAWYVHGTAAKPRELKKTKRAVIESVAWNRTDGDSEDTGRALFGTRDGKILGMRLTRAAGSKSSTARLIEAHMLYSLDPAVSVRGLSQIQFPSDASKFHIMAVASPPPPETRGKEDATGGRRRSSTSVSMTRFYEFVGGPDPYSVFDAYTKKDRPIRPKSRGLHMTTASSMASPCQLEVYSRRGEGSTVERAFAILSGRTVCYGHFHFVRTCDHANAHSS